jgi:hypothetical protein
MMQLEMSTSMSVKLVTVPLNNDKTLLLALVNNVWIGKILLALLILTLPERVFGCQLFPHSLYREIEPSKKGHAHVGCNEFAS